MNTVKQKLYETNLYRNSNVETAAQSSNRWHDRLIYEPEVTVVVALFDGRNAPIPHSVGIYDESWVDKLYRGIARNYKGYFDFVCLTDRNYIFSENIKQIRFDRSVDQYGWMSLMEWYHPKVCKTRRVTMGIDTIITGPLDDIFNCDLEDHKLGVCQDPIFPEDICNAMTIAEPSFCKEFWDYWIENEKEIMKDDDIFAEAAGSPSEMVLLRKLYGDSPRLDTLFKGRILSYKTHIRDHWDRVADASIIYFHGTPKPHQVNEKWVRENWV